jgi:YD repeat-containing protein
VDGYEAGNLLQYHKDNNMDVSYLWGYNNTYPIAKVVNARHAEVFFDNYEDEENPKGFRNTYDHYERSDEEAHSGKYSWKATSHNTYSKIITKIEDDMLDVNSKYTFSAWIKSDEVEAGGYINISLRVYSSDGSSSLLTSVDYDGTKAGEWQLLKLEVDLADAISDPLERITYLKCYIKNYGPGSQGLPAYYDDVRFVPSDAQMTTYTYDPLVGMTSVSDNFGRVTKYGFDGFNRLEEIRDNEGFIQEKYHYNYAE